MNPSKEELLAQISEWEAMLDRSRRLAEEAVAKEGDNVITLMMAKLMLDTAVNLVFSKVTDLECKLLEYGYGFREEGTND